MAMTQDLIVVGVFQDPAQARRAIDELKQAGYSQVPRMNAGGLSLPLRTDLIIPDQLPDETIGQLTMPHS